MTRLQRAAVAAVLTLAYLLLVGLAVAVTTTFLGGSTGLTLGILLVTAITWRVFYLLSEACDA